MTTPVSDDVAGKCIYCLLPKPGSREHLVPRSIGGNLVGRRVCKACNTGMSDIDQHLGDNAVVSMMRVANTPAGSFDVKLGGEQVLDDPSGRRVPVAIRNQYAPSLHPMMRFTPTPAGAEVGVHFSEAVDAKRLARFIDKHREAAFAELHSKRVDWLDAGEAAVVMHRAKDGYLAVADDAAEPRARALLVEKADELIAILEGSFPEAATIAQPRVQIAAELRLNDLYRAVAKVAFNLLAHRTADDFVLRSDFDDLRQYILGRDVRDVEGPDGAVVPDPRFVTWALDGQPFTFRDMEHTVVMTGHDGRLIAVVTIYRSFVFMVDMGPFRPPWSYPQVLVVRGDRQETRWLDLTECVELMREHGRPEDAAT